MHEFFFSWHSRDYVVLCDEPKTLTGFQGENVISCIIYRGIVDTLSIPPEGSQGTFPSKINLETELTMLVSSLHKVSLDTTLNHRLSLQLQIASMAPW